MRYFVLLLAVCSACSASSWAAPVPKGAQDPVLYFPTKVGSKWVYQWGKEERVETITATEKSGSDTVVTLGVMVENKPVPYCKLLVSNKGLFFGTGGLQEKTFPHCLLKIPSAKGEKWDWMVTEVNRKATRTAFEEEEVDVPAGKFRTIRVDSEAPVGKDLTQKTKQWYAVGIGWVKLVTKMGDAEEVRVLKSFTPGKE
jgi:hypothetical protein